MKAPAWSSVFVLAMGVFALMFLIAIDRQSWFHIRPATGAAAAMSKASDRAMKQRDTEARRFSDG